MYTNTVRHLHTYIYTKQCYIPSQGNIYSCDFSHKELANWHFNHETLPVIPNLSEWTIKTKTSLSIQYTMYLTKHFFLYLTAWFHLAAQTGDWFVLHSLHRYFTVRHRQHHHPCRLGFPLKDTVISLYMIGHLLHHFNRYNM